MKHYTRDDFQRYYHNAFILNPRNPKQVGQLAYIGGDRFCIVIEGGGNVDIDWTELEWKHVRCPPLGYFHLDDGYRFYHASKGPHDGVPKGLNPALVTVNMPAETRAAMQHTKLKVPVFKPQLSLELAVAISIPTYAQLEEAVEKLLTAPHSVGFALSADAGITLGLKKNEQLIGLYRGRKACYSPDGRRFIPVGEWAEGVTSRHFGN